MPTEKKDEEVEETGRDYPLATVGQVDFVNQLFDATVYSKRRFQLEEISILAEAFPKIQGDGKNINITNKVLTPMLDRIVELLIDTEKKEGTE